MSTAAGNFITETKFGESTLPFLRGTGNAPGIVSVSVNRQLTSRKIYCFFFAAAASGNETNFYLNGQVSFWDGGGTDLVGTLPVCYGNLGTTNSASSRSLPSCFNVGGSPSPDTVSLLLSSTAGTGITSNPILQPLYCDAECDTIKVDLLDSGGMGGSPNGLYRVYLQIVSSLPRQNTNPTVGP